MTRPPASPFEMLLKKAGGGRASTDDDETPTSSPEGPSSPSAPWYMPLTGTSGQSAPAPADDQDFASRYLDDEDDIPDRHEAPDDSDRDDGALPSTVSPPSTDPGIIETELAMPPGADRQALAGIRRRFALANHPDRVHPALRAIATQRMMIANRLIDRAIHRQSDRNPDTA